MVIFGTRPEAIKMAPVIRELDDRPGIRTIKVSTSQHREMLRQVLELFDIIPDFDLDIMLASQSICQIFERAVAGFRRVFSRVHPDLVLVQGDTTTAFTGALSAFNERIPVGHIEAGLRTWNADSPYPEEANRRMISVLARYHFAPTDRNARNLINEHVDPESILVTGNTVIDALRWVIMNKASQYVSDRYCFNGHRLILVTAHRRENFGPSIQNICKALLEISHVHKDVEIVYPVHMNTNIHNPVYSLLHDKERIHLTAPLNYSEFSFLLAKSHLILTDSGGLQEEAPALGKPVVIMRSETERVEALQAGTAVLAGTGIDGIFSATDRLLTDPKTYQQMARAVNPYGDGKAAKRIVDFLCSR
jgi:UDP-N-acetylglucosamine 2-epimerase (non-hydrolysing)